MGFFMKKSGKVPRFTAVTFVLSAILSANSVFAEQKDTSSRIYELEAKYRSGDTGGIYYDSDNSKIVINVPQGNPSIAFADLPNDVEVKSVKYSLSELKNWKNRAVNELMNPEMSAQTTGTAVGIDIVGNQVEITIGPEIKQEGIKKINELVAESAGKIKATSSKNGPGFVHSSSKYDARRASFRPLGADRIGSESILNGGITSDCSLGFNVIRNYKELWALTTGSCAKAGALVFADGQKQGQVNVSVIGDGDYALFKYSSGTWGSKINLHDGTERSITSFASAYVGRPVENIGAGSKTLRKGKILRTDVTANVRDDIGVNYILRGMVETDICLQHWADSASPFFDGDAALGVLSLTDGGCGRPDENGKMTTYFSPIDKLVNAYGLRIYPMNTGGPGAGGCQDCVGP